MHERTQLPIPTPDPMIGRTIHEFLIERKLAEGGMGAVYLARHRLMSSTLKVIKVLLTEYAANPILRQRFHREAEAASRLEHENILGIDNFGTLDDGQLFIMVPYLDGQPLDAYLRSRGGRLSPHRALHLVVQLCSALDYAHAKGIIHRDLKPGNIYLVPTSSNPYMLKLLDFGIAKLVGARDREDGPKTQRGIAMGTPGYMAVEQYQHADDVTHLADVYSLAVTIWSLVAGQLPWQHQDPSVLYFLQRTQPPERPPADVLPPAWAEVLLAALRVEPHARPESARALAMALASALPAIGSLPSGAEILAGLAPHFVRQAAPGDETIRNAASVDRIGPLLWPPRETSPGSSRDVPRGKVEPPPVAVAEVHAHAPRPSRRWPASMPGSPEGLPTTLSAATGVASGIGEPRAARWKLGVIAAGTISIAALATGTIATRVSSPAASSPDVAPLGSAEGRTHGAALGAKLPGSSMAPAPAPAPAPAVPPPVPAAPAVAPAPRADAAPGPVPALGHAPAANKMTGLAGLDDRPPAAGAPQPAARPAAGEAAAAKPPRDMRSVSDKLRPPARIDPDDVSGPEDWR